MSSLLKLLLQAVYLQASLAQVFETFKYEGSRHFYIR